jgi:hypothetical protein
MQAEGIDAMHWLLSLRADTIVQASEVGDIYSNIKSNIHHKVDDVQFPVHRSFFCTQRRDFFETVPLPSNNSSTSLGTRDDPYIFIGVTPLDFSRFLAVFSTP